MRRYTAVLCAPLFVMASVASEGTCDFLPQSQAPAWVNGGQGSTDTEYVGIGLAEQKRFKDSRTMLDAARQSAMRYLTESVQVTVRSQLTTDQRLRKSGKNEIAESSLESMTETIASASLQGVAFDEPWLDRNACVVWIRARVSKASVSATQKEQVQRVLLTSLRDYRERAAQESRQMPERLESIRLADTLLSEIDFSVLPDVSAPYYKQWVGELKQRLESGENRSASARQRLRDAQVAADKARLGMSTADKSREFRKATSMLRSLLADYPSGETGVFSTDELQLQLASLEEERGDTCAARSIYMKLMDSTDGATVDRARKSARNAACSPVDMEKSAWRRVFDGQNVTLVCAQKIGSRIMSWPKGCDTIGAMLRSYGAGVAAQAGLPSTEQISGLMREGGNAPVETATIFVLADGNIQKKKNPENVTGGIDYQFSGQLAVLYSTPTEMAFSDRFQATTGWNPMSEQMTMDVLALNLGKRWTERFTAYLNNQ